MEQVIPIVYEDVGVGHERCDINIRGNIPCVLELKATSCPIQPKEHWQAISYMRSLGRTFGAVINFNQSPTGRLLIDFILLKDGKPYLWNVDTCTPLDEPMNDY
jgi:GxxExxY protein